MRATTATARRPIDPLSQAAVTFAAVYREHFDYVWACLRHLGVHEHACDDAVQDVFLVVYRRLPEFDWRLAIRTWLFAIARRVAARHRRTAARTLRRHAALAQQPAPADPRALEDHLARQQAGQILFEFLDTLDEDKRAVFVLAHLDGLRGPDIADALEIPLNTVYSRLRVANERFRRQCELRRIREQRALEGGRDAARADQDARQRAWLLLAPKLDLAAYSGGAAASATGLAASVKVFALTVILGVGTAAGVRAATTADAPRPSGTFAAATLENRPEDEQPPARRTPVREADTAEALAGPPTRGSEPPTASPRRPTMAPIPAPPRGESPAALLEREAGLLRAMNSALTRNDPRAALEHAGRHALEFPDGQLAPDREASRALALCKLGRAREGRGVATIYLAENPSPALAQRVKNACGM